MLQSFRNQFNNLMNNEMRVLIVAVAILLIFIGFGGFKYHVLRQTNTTLNNLIVEKDKQISDIQFEKTSLSEALASEQNKNQEFENQIDDLTEKVGGLVKLSKIDEELLQKYSKVFFLNENYIPKRLSKVDEDFVYPEDREIEFLSNAMPFLKNLLSKAENEGLDLKVTSGYRSFDTQSGLKASYKVTYGAGTANQFSADQGYSEHQLGTAVDFTTSTASTDLTGFEQTPEYEWLQNNAYRYGFILSYPPNNTYYIFEPWHWRFVGEELATRLHRDKKNFFDLDQRDLDKYLAKIFDN